MNRLANISLVAASTLLLVSASAVVSQPTSASPARVVSRAEAASADQPLASPPSSPAAITDYLMASYPNSWGGAIIDSKSNSVTEYIVKADLPTIQTAVASYAQSIGNASTVSFVPVTHNFAFLDSLTQAISNDDTALAKEGVDLREWGPDMASNRVYVKVADYSSASAQVLEDAYGAGNVLVQPGDDAPYAAAGRFDDSSPWYGDDRISNPNSGEYCTSGFLTTGNASGKLLRPHRRTLWQPRIAVECR